MTGFLVRWDWPKLKGDYVAQIVEELHVKRLVQAHHGIDALIGFLISLIADHCYDRIGGDEPSHHESNQKQTEQGRGDDGQ